jgi:hypothetical protein
VSKNNKITAAKVRAKLIIHLEDTVSIRMRSRFPPPLFLKQLDDVLHEEWWIIPPETIQNSKKGTSCITGKWWPNCILIKKCVPFTTVFIVVTIP